METWPNFFIVGAPKAGTTSLYEYLKNIPGIYMSPVKEPNYFSVNLVLKNDKILKPIREINEYLNLFSDVKDEKIIGESSVHYLADPSSPKLIKESSPDAKILISLRDPVEREFSVYSMFYSRGLYESSFHKQLTNELKQPSKLFEPILRLNEGLYYEDVKRYLNIFGKDQVKIIIFEEWKNNRHQAITEILKFLELNAQFQNIPKQAYNEYVGRIVPRGSLAKKLLQSNSAVNISRKIIPETGRRFIQNKILLGRQSRLKLKKADREFLVKFYQDDVKKLQNFLGRDLPWKNFS